MELPLSQLKPGKTGIIKNLAGGYGFLAKTSSLGIRVGKKVKVLSSQPFRGPVVIKIDSMEIAVGRGMAEKIIVKAR